MTWFAGPLEMGGRLNELAPPVRVGGAPAWSDGTARPTPAAAAARPVRPQRRLHRGVPARQLDAHPVPYLVLNFVGSAILAVIAASQQSWGCLLLEGTWAIVSTASLVARLISRGDRPAPPPARRA